jgi:NodT family efflux transporter outer membrane factor (OMF) lipoprotein
MAQGYSKGRGRSTCTSNEGAARLVGRRVGLAALAGAMALLSGCMVGPDYVKPKVQVPAAYKESEGWKVAQPQDEMARGKWWEIYGDAQLNALEEQVDISNQNVAIAAAQFRQARALVQAARSAYYPTLTVGASAVRAQQSSTLGPRPTAQTVFSDFLLPVDVSWEADIWGKFRRALESAQASAQASAGDLEAVKLSAQAELAQDYFVLRALDGQKQLLDASAVAYEKSLQLTKNRYAAGVVSKTDIALAQTLLKATQAQAIDLGVQRAQFEHAIAVLIGKPPSEFSVPVAPLAAVPPPVPAGVPSALLERRPDIAAAERRVAAANAQIGVAVAAYYPSLTLSASVGFETTNLSQWLTAPSRFWSLGPAAVSETVLDGGLRQAQTAQARAIYDAGVASYRQTVLTGFREVEDNLAALRILEQEAQVQDQAVKAAQESVTLTTNQYKAGTVSYLDVVVSQTAALNNERTAVDILGRRVTASVLLVKALGGGWKATDLPTPDDLAAGGDVSSRSSVTSSAAAAQPPLPHPAQ